MINDTPNPVPPVPSPSPETSAPAAAPVGPAGAPRRRGFVPRRKVCRFCAEQVAQVDYKQVPIIRTFVTDTGKILSSRITGTCSKHQRQLARAIKRNRIVAFLPFSSF
ncbi:MAG: 30S ribosomal protein S18 [Elusimicrobia bacterium]|nr:30S ribosomal protein S18 [Elusimicrobiota bacterium]